MSTSSLGWIFIVSYHCRTHHHHHDYHYWNLNFFSGLSVHPRQLLPPPSFKYRENHHQRKNNRSSMYCQHTISIFPSDPLIILWSRAKHRLEVMGWIWLMKTHRAFSHHSFFPTLVLKKIKTNWKRGEQFYGVLIHFWPNISKTYELIWFNHRVSKIKALRMISMIIGGIMTVVRVCESPKVELKSVNYQVTPVTKSQLEFGE